MSLARRSSNSSATDPWRERTRLKAVLFDFDGTLTKPGLLDFSMIKAKIGCPPERPLLEYIQALPEAGERASAFRKLECFELEAAARAEANAGAEEIVSYLRSRSVKTAILSRNGRKSILRALENFKALAKTDLDLILSRDEPLPPKPDPAGVLEAARRLGVPAAEIAVIGDYVFDVRAGRSAGAATVFLRSQQPADYVEAESDHTISCLLELKQLLRPLLPLPPGKVPNDLLAGMLGDIVIEDEKVLVPPGVGEDALAVDIADDDVLVLKSDPVTFVSDSIGLYTVLVNANDIATSGATPRWLLATLLLPTGTTPAEIRRLIRDIHATCRKIGVSLCGGHTEITAAVRRPLVSAMLAGTVEAGRLIDKRGMRPGDRILLSKPVAVEGTSILAREFAGRLKAAGFSEAELEACRRLVSRLSILDEARIAAASGLVTAMHDVTEGGVATALRELAEAGGHGLRVDLDLIPVLPECERICRALELDPLGLIGSGSLLICCKAEGERRLAERIRQADIDAACIGEVSEQGAGIEARRKGKPAELPVFEVDEIARLYARP